MIPTVTNPLGFNPAWKRLLDAHTRFLIWGDLTDRTGNVTLTNRGLVSNGQWITSPDTSSYAFIPANSLPADVLVSDHSWSVEINFFIPENWSSGLTKRIPIFGASRTNGFYMIVGYPDLRNYIGVGWVANGIGPLTVPGINLFTVNYDTENVTFKLNGVNVTPTMPEPRGTTLDARGYDVGIMTALGYGFTHEEPTAYMMKINYIRISNVTR